MPEHHETDERPEWETFSHDADIGIRGFGATLPQAFEHAAVALTSIVTDPADVAPSQTVEVHCEAPDDDLLLMEWLNALVYEMATRGMLFSHFHVSIDGRHLMGRATGESVDRSRHRPAVEIKGATCTELSVFREPDGSYCAQCVVDV